jgi:protease-4
LSHRAPAAGRLRKLSAFHHAKPQALHDFKPLSWLGRGFRGLWAVLDGTRRALLNLLLLALLVGAVVAWVTSGPPALKPKTALVLNWAGPVVEQRSGSARDSALKQLQGEDSDQTRLRDVLAVLDAAAKDEAITHAVLMLDDFAGAGLPTLRELAMALERFKASGKPVTAWGSEFDQKQFFVAAHATQLWLHPMGSVYVEGYGRFRNYYKDLLDRVGVTAHVVRAGKYKNAAETYTASALRPRPWKPSRRSTTRCGRAGRRR